MTLTTSSMHAPVIAPAQGAPVTASVQDGRRLASRPRRQWPLWPQETVSPPASSMSTGQLCRAWCRSFTVVPRVGTSEGWAAAAVARAACLDEIERRHLAAATTLYRTTSPAGWPVDHDDPDPPSADER